MRASSDPELLWEHQNQQWRNPAQVIGQWEQAGKVDPQLLQYRTKGAWWEILAESGLTLLLTREYEHLVLALQATAQGPLISYLSLPHPSGLAVDRDQRVVFIASTRNPNQVYDLVPVKQLLPRLDLKRRDIEGIPLMPMKSRFYPGCLYIHDLAFLDGNLHANAVGENAVVQLKEYGRYKRVWWPRCIETKSGPRFGQNHLQLNSIAAGKDLKGSYFSASTDQVSFRRPGHKNFPVDKRGVIFSGATREPIVRGLTRPHSARLYQKKVWVDNSGYGELGFAEMKAQRFAVVTKLPGWTRGLFFHRHIAFVGTSRVLRRFHQYAPGLDVEKSLCGIHAVDTRSGQVLGSMIWPAGNQIFAIEGISNKLISGFPFHAKQKGKQSHNVQLFYAFQTSKF